MRRLYVAMPLFAALMLSLPALARASTFSVTSNADSGPGSLRAALASAGNGDTVTVPAMTVTLTSGQLVVPGGVTIQGSGARATVVSGGNGSAVFSTQAAGVTIEGLMVTHGKSSSAGGGIASNFGLTLSHVAIVNNQSTSTGGGVSISGGPAIIDHSLIARNQAPTGSGGGIYYAGTAGSSITDSTIADNTASGAAGGIYITTNGLLLDGDTLVGNVLTGASSQGGNLRDSANFSMRNTILAGGVAASGGDCYMSSVGTWTSLGHNAEDTDATPDAGAPNTCQYYFTGPGDRTGLNLQLGALGDHGGQTDTILPTSSSPVIDTADTTHCLADDQRGVVRPQGAGCDIGAVELSTPSPFSGFADSISTTTVTLHGTANTHGLAGTAHFVYGPTTGFGGATADSAVSAAATNQAATASITGLQPATTYYFALILTTADGSITGPTEKFSTTTTPPVQPPTCKVPRLNGRSLSDTKRILKTAHCALGKVHRPKHSRTKLIVLSQYSKAGTVHPAGYKVSIKLGQAPKGHKRRS